jgi:hypothetical protein
VTRLRPPINYSGSNVVNHRGTPAVEGSWSNRPLPMQARLPSTLPDQQAGDRW